MYIICTLVRIWCKNNKRYCINKIIYNIKCVQINKVERAFTAIYLTFLQIGLSQYQSIFIKVHSLLTVIIVFWQSLLKYAQSSLLIDSRWSNVQQWQKSSIQYNWLSNLLSKTSYSKPLTSPNTTHSRT